MDWYSTGPKGGGGVGILGRKGKVKSSSDYGAKKDLERTIYEKEIGIIKRAWV